MTFSFSDSVDLHRFFSLERTDLTTIRGDFIFNEATGEMLCASNVILRHSTREKVVRDFHVTWDLQLNKSGAFSLSADQYLISYGGEDNPVVKIALNSAPLATTARLSISRHHWMRVKIARTNSLLQFHLDGQLVLSVPDPLPDEVIGFMDFSMSTGLKVKRLSLQVEQAQFPTPNVDITSRSIHLCVDFFDDMVVNPWTKKTLEQAMRYYSSQGIRRIYFVHHYGLTDGFWDHSRIAGHDESIQQTAKTIGDFLPAFVHAAHAQSLELIAVFKPYETAFPYTYPYGSDEAKRYGKLDRIDGLMWWCPNIVAEHPDWRIQRRRKLTPTQPIAKIVLIAEENTGREFDLESLELWTSATNGGYQKYNGPLKIERRGVSVIVSEFEIKDRFVTFSVASSKRCRFGNILKDLIRVYDTNDQLMPITHAVLTYPRNLQVAQAGFVFDYPQSSGSAISHDYFWLDGKRPLAIAIGQDAYHHGALCEADPRVRQWWMQQVENCVNAGVDGIDFRMEDHQRAFDWFDFVYHPDFIIAYQNRYGVDLDTGIVDTEAVRRLRGELVTDFLREATTLLRKQGKSVHLHISSRMQNPSWHTEKEIHFDWRQWIQEGLMDEITLKTGNAEERLAREVIALASEKEIKVNQCPYLITLADAEWGQTVLKNILRESGRRNIQGMVLYENVCLCTATSGGDLNINRPWLLDEFQSWKTDPEFRS